MAWANFVDKTANINDPANYIQGSLQKSKPDPQQLGDYWLANHPNWLQVDDKWTPPAPPLTKADQYDAINATYSAKLSGVVTAIVTLQSQSTSDLITAKIATLQRLYASTRAEWKNAILMVK